MKKPLNNVKELYTDKKENQIFLMFKEILSGEVSKSYMTNGLLILYAGNYLRISSYILGSPFSYMTLQLLHSKFPYIRGFFFLFYHCSLAPVIF